MLKNRPPAVSDIYIFAGSPETVTMWSDKPEQHYTLKEGDQVRVQVVDGRINENDLPTMRVVMDGTYYRIRTWKIETHFELCLAKYQQDIRYHLRELKRLQEQCMHMLCEEGVCSVCKRELGI